MSQILNPLTFPLYGTRLIEASAGTGKTYTIAALYLRLVLGHGGTNSFSRPLTPPEILVVTFTNAATEELRDRIRRRLTQAAKFFMEQDDGDDFLKTLRNEYPQESWSINARLLDNAAQWMDEASIHTIHSWCQKMLRQHAFDSGSLFDLKLSVNDDELIEDATCDYWRCHFYTKSVQDIFDMQSMTSITTPQELLKKVKPLLYLKSEASSDSSEELPDPFEVLRERRKLIESARAIWESDFDTAIELIRNAQKNGILNGTKYKAESLENWIEEMRLWVKDKGALPSDKVLEKFSASGLASGVKKNKIAPKHLAFEALDSLLEQLADNPYLSSDKTFQSLFYTHAAGEIRKRLSRVKERLALMGFEDMITRLDDAIWKNGNQRLAEVIGDQYPVAMIDEFQDTDPVQYRIFSKIYLNQSDKKGFFMIGDPKQAIYAFRGADIYTYLTARRDCEGNLYTLDKNFRSTHGMVQAANQMFGFANNMATHPEGPFLFKDQIPFEPVSAKGRDEQFVVQDSEMVNPEMQFKVQDSEMVNPEMQFKVQDSYRVISGINLCHLNQNTPVNKTGNDGYIEQMAQLFADKIVRLLNLAAQSPPRAGFAVASGFNNDAGFDNDTGFIVKPLRPSDMAILVRNFREATAIRKALEMRNVRTVYLSDKDSVFDSEEASSLLYLLRACSEPTNEAYLKAALAVPVLAIPLNLLDELNQNEIAWENQVERFRNYLSMWQHQGVLPMIRAKITLVCLIVMNIAGLIFHRHNCFKILYQKKREMLCKIGVL
ncbi:MAG: UvrD-helicase domain-containing protein, partial [Desulfamplus sp.]|nr:UvrD-helicase domain-containing protein [Desulfamplus sp.]